MWISAATPAGRTPDRRIGSGEAETSGRPAVKAAGRPEPGTVRAAAGPGFIRTCGGCRPARPGASRLNRGASACDPPGARAFLPCRAHFLANPCAAAIGGLKPREGIEKSRLRRPFLPGGTASRISMGRKSPRRGLCPGLSLLPLRNPAERRRRPARRHSARDCASSA